MAATSATTMPRCLLVLFALGLTLVSSVAAFALSTPDRTGWVTDAAHILDADAMSVLANQLEELQRKTGDEVVVVTLSDLQGVSIESWGNVLGDSWKIGKFNGRDDGVVLIVAPNDRKVRIAVGYGLGNRISDPIAAEIIADHILPAFRSGDIPAGIRAGIESIAAQLESPPGAMPYMPPPKLSFWVWLRQNYAPSRDTMQMSFWVLVVIVVVVVALLSNGSSGGSGRRGWYGNNTYGSNSGFGWHSSGSSWGGGSFGGGFSGGGHSGGGSFGGGASGSW